MKTVRTVTRRDVLQLLPGLGVGLILCSKERLKIKENGSRIEFLEDIGVCTSIENHDILDQSGYTYIEEGVRRFLIPEESENSFQKRLLQLRTSKLPIYACNGFIPSDLKSVGVEVHHDAILHYSETTFRRAKIAGIKTIVFGSSGSRSVPDGFDRTTATNQFCTLLSRMAPIAKEYDIVISLEPLNQSETNFINTLSEGVEIIETVGHPNIKLCADIYHMMQEGESAEEIVKADTFLHHCHIAEKENRTAPSVMGDDFRSYFRALHKIGYSGNISIECRWNTLSEQLPLALKEIQKQISEVSSGPVLQ